MNLKGILAISGYSGLFKLVSQTKNGIIVESLEDKKRMPAYATSKISALEDIAIFTEDEDLPLSEVFKKIYEKENGGDAIDPKSKPEALKTYFGQVLPTYDKDRVYVSDMKRLFSWYQQALKYGLFDLEEEPKTEEEQKAE